MKMKRSINQQYLWLLGIMTTLIAGAVAYFPSLHGMAIWDDHQLLSGAGIGGGKSVISCFTHPFLHHYFRPIVSLSFFIDRSIWGVGPVFYHQTNIILHLLATVLLIFAVREAFQSKPIALISGILFALQPAQVSTVAWIGGRTDSLCTVWIALWTLSLIKAAHELGKRRIAWVTAASFTYVVALFTKEQSIALLPMAPFAFYCFRLSSDKKASRTAWALLATHLAAAFLFLSLWFINFPDPFRPFFHSPFHQAALFGWTVTYYTLLLALPAAKWMQTLSLGAMQRYGIGTALLGGGIGVAAIIFLGRWIRTDRPRAWFLASILFYMLPVSNMIPLPSLLAAPYRAGVAGLAFAALLAATLVRIAEWLLQNERFRTQMRPALAISGAALLVWNGGLTIWGVSQWQQEGSLFTSFIRYDPDSMISRVNMISLLLRTSHSEEAERESAKMLTHLFGSDAWKNRASTMQALRQDPKIMQTIRDNQGNSIHAKQWMGDFFTLLGASRLANKNLQGSRQALHIALAINPEGAKANFGIACCEMEEKRNVPAMHHLQIAVAADPELPAAHALLGTLYSREGKHKAALTEFDSWVRVQPWLGDAYLHLAKEQLALGYRSQAISTLQHALKDSICNWDDMKQKIARLQTGGTLGNTL